TVIAPRQICDGIFDCSDLSDECLCVTSSFGAADLCSSVCYGDQSTSCSQCRTVYKLFLKQVCNGISECQNGEDERNCSGRFECDAGHRVWLTGSKKVVSIDNKQKCDAVFPPECLDYSDEVNCSESTHFYCESGTPFFVRRDQVTDGNRDCADASDECPPNVFQASDISSREELIKSPFLRAMIWFMACVAINGNALVFFFSLKSLWENSKKAKVLQAPRVAVINKLLILNLSIADFLMGVALLIIAIKSAQFSGQYCWRDLLWRSSTTCDVIGVLSVLSCEASVLSLVCLTSYRLYTIYFPLKSRTVSTKVATIWIIGIWVLCFVLALLPLSDHLSRYMVTTIRIKTTPYLKTEMIRFDQLLAFTKRISVTQRNVSVEGVFTTGSWSVLQRFLNTNFPGHAPEPVGYFGYYSASAVCLPRYFKLTTDQLGLNEISAVIMSFNFITLLYISAAYAAIYKRTSSGAFSANTANRQQTEQRQKNAKNLQRKISILILTDFSCWLPVCLMTFISYRESGLPSFVYSVSAIILLPINSSLNPIIYTDAVPKLYR
uniref:G-protein coupled receptors family 1 profile domain-containing protein n=1 Tax=Ciona intestinalis TaxID=7719 RepID=H2XR57_CIOIN